LKASQASLDDRAPANAEETVAVDPVIGEPIEVEPTPVEVVPQYRDMTVQVDLGDRAEANDRIFPLFLGVFLPEGEDVADLTRIVAVFLHQPNGFFGRDIPIEVEKLPLPLADLVGGDGEFLLGEIAVGPAVVAARDAVGEREVGVDGHELVNGFLRHHRFRSCGQELNLEFARKDIANLVFAADLLDQSVEFASSQVFGCKIAHRILLGLLCPLESSPHPETLDSGNFFTTAFDLLCLK